MIIDTCFKGYLYFSREHTHSLLFYLVTHFFKQLTGFLTSSFLNFESTTSSYFKRINDSNNRPPRPPPHFLRCSSEVLSELALVEIVEVGVLHGHAAGDTFVGLKSYHTGEEIEAVLIQVLGVLRHRNSLPLGESGLEIG